MISAKELEAYAMSHYEAGGHWVVETYSNSDYQAVIDEAGGDIDAAKAALKKAWLSLVAQQRECY
jgi:hypothetical protein